MGLSQERIFEYGHFFKHVKIVIYKFCIHSKYACIRFDTFSYGEAARGVLSAQNFPVLHTCITYGGLRLLIRSLYQTCTER